MRLRTLCVSLFGPLGFLAAPLACYAQDDVQLGEELFQESCARCHGDDAAGLTGYQGSLEQFTERLEGITENMPDFAGYFEPEEVEALHQYLMVTLGAEE